MKKILLTATICFAANYAQAQCTDLDFQWPEDLQEITSCNGVTPTILAEGSWSGEYTEVNLTAGNIYKFYTTEPDYFITISSLSGQALQYGKGEVLYSPTTSGSVYFLSHVDENCNSTWFDDHDKMVVCSLPPTAVPSCTTATLPTGANPNDPVIIKWNATAATTSYKVYIGTSAGNYNIVNGTSTGGTSYTLSNSQPNTNYYVKIVPTNAIGDAENCAEVTFATGNADYCTSIPTNIGFNDGITLVNLAGESKTINNVTTANAGSEYTNYYNTHSADLAREKQYNINVRVNTDGNYTQYQIVWIDWNQDKVFGNDEMYDLGTAANVSNGLSSLCPFPITVPANALLGDTRMRVRSFYYAGNKDNPCKNGDDGEVEDYKITVLDKLAVSDLDKAKLSVYPNPFQDVVKISDIKNVKSISVNDISGKLVKSLVPSNELDLSSLKAGVYIINLNLEDGSTKSFKSIKK